MILEVKQICNKLLITQPD